MCSLKILKVSNVDIRGDNLVGEIFGHRVTIMQHPNKYNTEDDIVLRFYSRKELQKLHDAIDKYLQALDDEYDEQYRAHHRGFAVGDRIHVIEAPEIKGTIKEIKGETTLVNFDSIEGSLNVYLDKLIKEEE